MTRLGHSDMTAILDFVGTSRSFPDLPSFREGVLPGLGDLVPCDLVGYNEVDARSGSSMVLLDRPDVGFDGVEETLARLAHQHPVIRRQATGQRQTAAISDFLSAREFHRLELYDDLYRRLGAEDQLAFGLPGDVIVGIAFNRDKRTFSERDRAVLETVRPHMADAYRHTRARERTAALVAALADGIQRAGGAVLALDRHGRVDQVDVAAQHLLSAYCGPGLPPAPLKEWLDGSPESAPLELAGERGRLSITYFRGGDSTVLLLEEHLSGPDATRLRELGLTRREAEVLELVAIGRTNAQIAGVLVISPATVRKHLEKIYARLGVHSRTEAAARAHGSPRHDPG